MSGALQVAAHGRPSISDDELIDKVIRHLSKGNYLKPAIEASGIGYSTFRGWMTQGERDRAAGLTTPHTALLDRLTRAQADAEAALVAKLEEQQDWRAQAFILERRHRERWGKDTPEQRAAVVIQVSDAMLPILEESLRVARATVLEGELVPPGIEQSSIPDGEVLDLPTQSQDKGSSSS